MFTKKQYFSGTMNTIHALLKHQLKDALNSDKPRSR